ncbi:hypothetical protein J6590_025086 [Homalodisca vitripennis]|nr:hypothetical protein J6590_025086 [Homalodisca vitripennis]
MEYINIPFADYKYLYVCLPLERAIEQRAQLLYKRHVHGWRFKVNCINTRACVRVCLRGCACGDDTRFKKRFLSRLEINQLGLVQLAGIVGACLLKITHNCTNYSETSWGTSNENHDFRKATGSMPHGDQCQSLLSENNPSTLHVTQRNVTGKLQQFLS